MNRGYATWASRWRVPMGFALGAAYLVFAQPTPRHLLAGGGVALAGTVLRAAAAGHLDKSRKLATSGPYAYTRNPLYLGSGLMGAGFAVAGNSWIMAVAFAVWFGLVYWPVMRSEEDFLCRQFGQAYRRYAEKTSLFFPTGRGARASTDKFRWERYRKNREYEAALGCVAGMAFLALKMALR